MPPFVRLPLLALAAVAVSLSPADARSRPYTGGKQCISVLHIRDKTSDAADRLILHVGGDRAYVNHLPEPCDGLRSANNLGKVKLMAKGDRICAGDLIRISGDTITGMVGLDDRDGSTTCKLGRFEGVSEMSLSEFYRR